MRQWEIPETLRILQSLTVIRAPQGESYLDVQIRVVDFLNELLTSGGEDVALVSHAGVIRTIVAYVLRVPIENLFAIHVGLGSISQIQYDGAGGKLLLLNR
jgi:alpha-ribazole phosphatase